jgi:hypothetical protein
MLRGLSFLMPSDISGLKYYIGCYISTHLSNLCVHLFPNAQGLHGRKSCMLRTECGINSIYKFCMLMVADYVPTAVGNLSFMTG